jgi:hypothetical protein
MEFELPVFVYIYIYMLKMLIWIFVFVFVFNKHGCQMYSNLRIRHYPNLSDKNPTLFIST